jgi:hypothetical protein
MRQESFWYSTASTRPTRTRSGSASLCTRLPVVPEFLDPEIALVTAGVETDVLGIGRDHLTPQDLAAVTATHPRPQFKQRILVAFAGGMKHRPQTTSGTSNADVLQRFDPTFVRDDFVDNILNNTWPE